MKSSTIKTIIFSSVFLIIQFGCEMVTDKDGGNTLSILAKDFEIHLQWQFSKTPVAVYVDNSQLLLDTVSSHPTVGVAKIISVPITNGIHSLRVIVENSLTKDTTFTIQDTLYIGVQYSQQNSLVTYIMTRHQFIYD